MDTVQFRADGLEHEDVRDWHERSQAGRRVPRSVSWIGVVAALLYAGHYPGAFVIAALQGAAATTDRFVAVTGTIDNPLIESVALDVNGSYRAAPVQGGRFTSLVPLHRGVNVIQASVGGVAALVSPGSNVLNITADIPPSDIWSELTWDGPGDIDLHLYLPNGGHVFYRNRAAAGALLDVDNQVSDGPEHIVMDHAEAGTYRMTVLYFSGAPRPVPWHVRLLLRDGATTRDFSGVLMTEGEETEFWSMEWPSE